MTDTVVFILGYRSLESLREGSLGSLSRAASRIGAQLVYLDNYGRDGSIEFVRNHYPEADILMSPRNLMYCQGLNCGLQYIDRRYRPAYYILSDADNFVEDDAFEALHRRAVSDASAGIIQPLVRSRKTAGLLYSCGHRYDEQHFCRPMSALPENRSVLDDLPSCSILSTLFRREIFERCGLIEPLFDIYYESSDISFRAKKEGFRCVCEPQAVAYHEANPGLDYNSYHLQYYVHRNLLLFWRLHDLDRFESVKAQQEERLHLLQCRHDESEFGLDALAEAVRNGIRDGLRLAQDLDLRTRRLPRLSEYEKGMPILLHAGGSAS